ncbi:hypothetical protein EJ02DRAFT_421116 [Clathrospora elynae]|uniref:Uncharacterized protein n=1 Tax=Clathrospora elynae TaxID=706981 RepID=A0A6A5SUW8_9PLEO|nr:hypothetical protein EJ02DRAFT_421116 [Clathrospora elynae]
MLFYTITLATLLTTAAAGVVPAIKVDHLTGRSEGTWDKGGNIKLTFSNEDVDIGGLSSDEIIGAVAPICHESGQCETNDVKLNTFIYSANTANTLEVTIGPDGSYPTWIRNGLLDTLAAAVRTMAKCENGTYTDRCRGTNAMAYCPDTEVPYTNCKVPKYWGINYQSADSVNAAPPNLGMDIESKEGGDGLCQGMLTGLGAVAGAVHGVGGGVFTLLSFLCK